MQTNQTKIHHEIDEIKRGMRRTWAQIGCLLSEIDETGYWRGDSATFTAWMSSHAADFGVGLTILWAQLRMVRYYRNTMLGDLLGWGIKSPTEACDLPEVVKCDLMEIYSRIANVAPDDVKRALAEKVMTGTARRSELRATWHAYRNQGLLAPGKRGRISADNLDAVRQRADKMFDADLLTALALDKQWAAAREDRPVVYKILQKVDLKQVDVSFDIIILVKFENDRLQLHGVDVLRSGLPNYKQLLIKRPFVDHLWLALPGDFKASLADRIPRTVGKLMLDGTKLVAVEAELGDAERQPTESNLLLTARCLLEK